MRLSNAEVLRRTRRYLDLLSASELSREQREGFIAETVENYASCYNRGILAYRKSVTQAGQFAALEWSGQGSILRDLLGREYIDCLGGYGIFSAGINHPAVVRAVQDQLPRMALNSQELLEPWRGALARVLADVTPGNLQHSFFISNGTDAVEGALKLARLYTGRHTFIATIGGFHGKSLGALSLMGKAVFREPFQQGMMDVRFVPFGDADALDAELARLKSVGTRVAGVVVEPVQGEAGALVPPDEYLPRVRESCSRYGALLIADEVQTGLGRTGRMWAVDHWDVVPDILCLGKALGGGVMPLSAFVSTREIWDVLVPNPILHSTTFGGNPLACVAGLAAIRVTLEDDLPGQAAASGAWLLGRLQEIQRRHPEVIRSVRGRGLLIGLELADEDTGCRIAAELFARGVLVAGTCSNARVLRLEPALNIPRSLLEMVVERLEESCAEVRAPSGKPIGSAEPAVRPRAVA
jgi:putrescine aminotransferase